MTLFTKIIKGEIPAYKIQENDRFFAFLDIYPCTPGHTLVVPKVEVDRLFDLPEDYLEQFLPFCEPIANAIKRATGADRVNMLTLGFEIAHAHIHLIPMNSMDDMDLMSRKYKAEQDELIRMQSTILTALELD